MSYPADLTLRVKVCPRTLRGVLPLASAVEVMITTQSRALKPYPPGNVKLNGQGYATWPATTTGDVTLSWSHRSRLQQGALTPLVHQDVAGSYSPEGTITVEVLIGGAVKRTWASLTSTSQVYTLAQRQADDSDPSKAAQFRITPVNGSYTGTARTTPSFIMG